MTEPDSYSYPRYLDAKRSVDARALNRRVWGRFVEALSGCSSPVRVLEVGGGVGATVERVVEALEGASPDRLHYTLVDIEPDNVAAARERLQQWADRRGYSVSGREQQTWTDGAMDVTVRFVTADLFDLASAREEASYDALIAQAVLDLFDISAVLRALRPLLRSGGLWYLPIHFDGVTAFEPPVDPALDARIEQLYHESMAEAPDRHGGPAGPHCGRRLLTRLPELDAPLLDAGSSDWIVVPRDGEYPGDEAYFLHHILRFVETELSGHPELTAPAFAEWLRTRRRQIDDGTLVYVAHQLDVLAQTA